MRLIDADELREDWLRNGTNEYIYDTNDFLDSIDDAPTVDAVPVVHGRWINAHKSTSSCKCTVCGSVQIDVSKYCPNCGAKMGAEEGAGKDG